MEDQPEKKSKNNEKPKEEAKKDKIEMKEIIKKSEDKKMSKIDEILKDMFENYPELEITEGLERPNFLEKLKAYYQIKQMEFQKEHLDFIKLERIIIIALTAFNVGLLFFNVWFSYENIKTTQELYLIPKEPTLKYIWMETEGSFSQQELSRTGDQLTYIRICFYNEGRAPTGHIYANIKIGHSYFNSGGLNIDNILGGQTNCSNMFLVNNKPIGVDNVTGKAIFDEWHIPQGNQTLELYVDCEFCVKEPLKIVKIPICIWGRNYSSTDCEWTRRRNW